MTPSLRRHTAMVVAERMLFLPYLWGGNDPIQGYDCSGMVIEVLKSCGVLPVAGDWSADDLFRRFSPVGIATDFEPKVGDLVFWIGDNGRMRHVEIVYDPFLGLSIGASGGGSKTLTIGDASDQDAYIKIRSYRERGGTIFADPYREV